MKKHSHFLSLFLLFICRTALQSQTANIEPLVDAGELYAGQNSPAYPCISDAEYALIEKRCTENRALLSAKSQAENSVPVALYWPLKAAAGFTDCSFYYISAHVDQNTTTGAITDYNCGTRNYDGHRGTDIAIGPFGFYKMDNSQVEVVSAAAGVIVDKSDGNFDRNCSTNNLTWTFTSTTAYNFSYKGYTKNLPTQPRTYTFQGNYNGITCFRWFNRNFQFAWGTSFSTHDPAREDRA